MHLKTVPTSRSGLRRFRSALRCAAVISAVALYTLPAAAQSVNLGLDLDAELSDLLDIVDVGTSTSGGTTPALSVQVGALDDVVTRLVGPTGVIAAIGDEVNAQGDLLDLQAGDLLSLRADLSDLRGLVDANGDATLLDIAELRGLVADNAADILGHGTTLDAHATELANLRATTGQHGADIDDLQGRVGDHDAALATHTQDIGRLRSTQTEHAGQLTMQSQAIAAHDNELDAHARLLAGQAQGMQTLRSEIDRRVSVVTSQDATVERQGRAIASLDQRMQAGYGELSGRINEVDRRVDVANEGVAMALALKTPAVADDKNFTVSGGWGTFEGENAFAVSGAVRAADNIQVDAGVALGAAEGTVGGRAGATLSW